MTAAWRAALPHAIAFTVTQMRLPGIVGTQKTAETAVAARSGLPEAPGRQEDNVLDFALAQRRTERGRPTRSARTKNKPNRRE